MTDSFANTLQVEAFVKKYLANLYSTFAGNYFVRHGSNLLAKSHMFSVCADDYVPLQCLLLPSSETETSHIMLTFSVLVADIMRTTFFSCEARTGQLIFSLSKLLTLCNELCLPSFMWPCTGQGRNTSISL